MSLVICSNKLESSNPYDRFGQDQSAGSFRNHLVNTLELPANAEVAVQSVKVNKAFSSRDEPVWRSKDANSRVP